MTTAAITTLILITLVACLAAYGYLTARRPGIAGALVCSVVMLWTCWSLTAGWHPFGVRADAQIALRASQWRCARAHTSRSTALIPMGKAMMPITTTQDVCDRYERR